MPLLSVPIWASRWPRWLKVAALLVMGAALLLGWICAADLYPPKVLLEIQTDPPGGDVWLDGKHLGVSPVEIDVSNRFHRTRPGGILRESLEDVWYWGLSKVGGGLPGVMFGGSTMSGTAPDPRTRLQHYSVSVGRGWCTDDLRLHSVPAPVGEDVSGTGMDLRDAGLFWRCRQHVLIMLPYAPPGEQERLQQAALEGEERERRVLIMAELQTADLSVMERYAKDSSPTVRSKVVEECGRFGASALPLLHLMLRDVSSEVRVEAVRTLARAAGHGAVPELEDLLGDPDWGVRAAVVRALGEVGDASLEPALRKLLEDKSAHVRREASQALERWMLKEDTSPVERQE